MRAFGGFPPGGRRSFFKSLHRLGILLVGPRPGAHMRKAQVLQGAVDRVVRYREPKLLMQPHDEVARAPATIRALLVETDHPIPSVWRSMPAFVSASVRELPSSTAAIASSRRACAASFACFANRRTPAAV